jgi:lysophospholipase L1-like esterase
MFVNLDPPLDFKNKRLGFMGDSITDGHTLILLVKQSLQAAGIEPPICTNMAVCGNRAHDMLKRWDRDVLSLKPDVCLLSVGVNDANNAVSLSTYQQHVTQLLDRFEHAGIEVLLLTPTPITNPQKIEQAQPLINAYVQWLERESKQRGLRLASVNRAFHDALAQSVSVLGNDGIHLDFPGYRIMARCVLNAMGHAHVPVVDALAIQPMPGLIEHWHIRPATHSIALTEEQVGKLEPDSHWHSLELPLKQAVPDNWWLDQERQRGFAVSLGNHIGSSKHNIGIAILEQSKDQQVYLNTGANLKTIWLNGQQVYNAPGDSGWHAGRERIPIQLSKGNNHLVIEFSDSFFLSMTDTGNW